MDKEQGGALDKAVAPVTKALKFAVDYSPQILFGLATIPAWLVPFTESMAFSIYGVDVSWAAVLTVTAIIMLICGLLATIWHSKTIHGLEQEVVPLRRIIPRLDDSLDDALQDLMFEIELVTKDSRSKPEKTHERATLYLHDESQNSFIPIARRSDNPKLEPFGRPYYPDNQGIIGAAWTKGYSFVNDLSSDRLTWEQQAFDDYDIPVEAVSKIRMQSCSLMGIRIDLHNKKFGLVVLESEKKRGITTRMKTQVFESPEFAAVCALMELKQFTLAQQPPQHTEFRK